MKKTIRLINVLLLTFLIITYSCKKDDEIVVTLDDLEVTIDENPTDGQVIGTVQGNGANSFTFSIDSQSPNGALNINTSTGELTVADPTLFDFETNPAITATVSANEAQNTATVTINLNDVDEIVAQDVNFTINENPSNGDLIGALQATAGSNLTYTISFQNPSGAFTINQSTGEISVADKTLFDFETTTNMLATISISNGIYSVSKNAFVTLNDVHEVGEFKFGGVIFWIDPVSNNSSGLVCAIENSTQATWGCSGTASGATGTAIGTGAANTQTIMASNCATGSAAEYVSNLSLNGFDDWFLPSVDEFNEIVTNYSTYIWPTIQANGGSALFSTCWTSTERDNNNAYIGFIGGAAPIATIKNLNKHILPIRAWSDL